MRSILTKLCISLVILPGMVIAASNQQTINGNCNFVFNGEKINALEISPTLCVEPSSSKDIANTLKKLALFLEVTNPTSLEITDAAMMRWATDPEEYLSLKIENKSSLPAQNLKVQFLAPVRTGEKQSRPLNFTRSQAFSASQLKHLGVAAHKSLTLPVAPQSELVRSARASVPEDYELIGVGLSPNMPGDLQQAYASSKGLTTNYFMSTKSASLGINISYETIFGGKAFVLNGMYLYFGKIVTPHPVSLPDQGNETQPKTQPQ